MGCTSARPLTNDYISKKIKIIWVDPKVDNHENSSYIDQLRSIGLETLKLLKMLKIQYLIWNQ